MVRTRYGKGGGVAGWSLSRKIVSRGANLAASFLLGATTSDLTGAFRLYRRSVLMQLLSSTTSKGYAFQVQELLPECFSPSSHTQSYLSIKRPKPLIRRPFPKHRTILSLYPSLQMEVAVRAQYSGFRIEEVPIVFVDRLLGQSKLGPSEFYLFIKGLLRLAFTL